MTCHGKLLALASHYCYALPLIEPLRSFLRKGLPVNISRYDAHARHPRPWRWADRAPRRDGTGHPATRARQGSRAHRQHQQWSGRGAAGTDTHVPGQPPQHGTVTPGASRSPRPCPPALRSPGPATTARQERTGRLVHHRLARGRTRTFLVTARVTRPPAQMLRLAAIACVALAGARQPIVCAAHLDKLPAATAGKAGPARRRPARARRLCRGGPRPARRMPGRGPFRLPH